MPQASEPDSAMEKLGTRVRQRALTGAEASSIGFLLVLYIGVFAGLGYWLDTLFKTSWIVAVGVLLGFALGFREMFRLAQKLGRESIADDAQAERMKLTGARQSASVMSTPTVEEAHARPRIFSVPSPFDANEKTEATPEDEALIEKLLDEKDETK